MTDQKLRWVTNAYDANLTALPNGKGYSLLQTAYHNCRMGLPKDASKFLIEIEYAPLPNGQTKTVPPQQGYTQQQLEEQGVVGLYRLE